MAGPFSTSTNLLAPIEGDPAQGGHISRPEHVDPVPDVRTMLTKRRNVVKRLTTPGFESIEVAIYSMNAAQRSEWVATITTVVDDEGRVTNLHPLNKMIAARCIHLTNGEPMFKSENDPLLDEIEGVVFEELVGLAQEVNGLATGAQDVSTEEEITVKG